jgi:hypothetical protein
MVPVSARIPFYDSEGTGICAFQNLWHSYDKQALGQDKTIVRQGKCTKGRAEILRKSFQIGANSVVALRRHHCSYRRIYGQPT